MPGLHVHLVRHGKVASHRGDVAVEPEGYGDIESCARRLGSLMSANERIYLLFSPTRRSRETAVALYSELSRESDAASSIEIVPPAAEQSIRNPDLFLAGARVEMVSTPEAFAEQISEAQLSPALVGQIPFYRNFLSHRDRIGFWVDQEDPPGEDSTAVARRVITWSLSLQDGASTRSRRYVCITHSPIMRAVLRHYLLMEDASEPNWVESIDVILDTPGQATVCYRGASRTVLRT